MSKLSFIFYPLCFIILIILSGCEKEEVDSSSDLSPLPKFSNSYNDDFKEDFFRVAGKGSKSNRNDINFIFHPEINRILNYFHTKERENPFVAEITSKIGFPMWSESLVSTSGDQTLTLVPFAFNQEDKVTAIMEIARVKDNYVVDAKARNHLVDDLAVCHSTDLAIKYFQFNKEIFNSIDNEIISLVEACDCQTVPPEDNEIVVEFHPDCVWYTIEICSDGDTQTDFVPSYKPLLPPYLDVDGDGIPNNEDDDFQQFYELTGYNTEALKALWMEYWNENWLSSLGEWDDFYDELSRSLDFGYDLYDNYDDYPDFYSDRIDYYADMYERYVEAYEQYMDQYGDDDRDGIPNGWDDDRDGNGQIDEHENDDPCYYDDGGIRGDNTDYRDGSVICEWYYLKDCNDSFDDLTWQLPDFWSNLFDDVIPCPNCSDEQARTDRQVAYVMTTSILNELGLTNTFLREKLIELGYACPTLSSEALFYSCFTENLEVAIKKYYYDVLGIIAPSSVVDNIVSCILSRQCVTSVEDEAIDALYDYYIGTYASLDLSEKEKNWLKQDISRIISIHQFLSSHKNNLEDALLSVKSITQLGEAGQLSGPYSSEQYDEILAKYNFTDVEEHYPEYIVWYHILKKKWENEHPDETCGVGCRFLLALEAQYRASSGELHTAADICGLVPGGGEPCDLFNGILYIIEGDGVNASISFAATIPIAGWTATTAKWAAITVKVGSKVKKLKIYKGVDGLLTFSHNSSTAFRKILQMTGSEWVDHQAHHIIPKAFWDHPVIQKAAKSRNNPFHMNHVRNGVPIHKDFHNGSHPNYSSQIEDWLDNDIDIDKSPSELAEIIKNKQEEIFNILENTTEHIENIDLPL